jgi:hypothetical protein
MTASEPKEPVVCKAVRAVGILKPKFQPGPGGKVFAESLEVTGTSFWLKDYHILATCAHVVKNLATAPIEVAGLLVVGNRGNYARSRVGIVDFTHDLALLIPDLPIEVVNKEAAEGLEIADAYPDVGTEVAYAGFPLGTQLLDDSHAPTYAEGVVGAQIRQRGKKKEIQITGTVVGGFSGSPLVDKTKPNQVIGVLSSSPSKEAGDAHIFMAPSWEHLRALAEVSRS